MALELRSWFSPRNWSLGAQSRRKRLLDELSRSLDDVERLVPMQHGYERIDPYVVEKSIAGIDFSFIVYHVESKLWFGDCESDGILNECQQNHLVSQGDVVFDLGCNAGFLTTWFAKKVGRKGQVHAFDPFPWNTLSTKYNALINGCHNVHTHTVGVAGSRRTLKIPHCDCKIYENQAIPQEMCFDATLVPLDDYSKYRPNFIKVDIEGAERELFEGCRVILNQPRKPTFVIEMHHDYIEAAQANPDDIPRYLTQNGYECREGSAQAGVVRDGSVPCSRSCALFARPRQ